MPVSRGAQALERRRRFVAEYLVRLDATAAALAAGYAKSSARVSGCQLLKRPEIRAQIDEAQNKLQARTEITQDRVLNELALLAFSSVDHYELDEEGNLKPTAAAPKGAIRAVSSVKRRVTTDPKGNVTREVEYRLWDKPGPLKTAGRHVGLFNEKAMTAAEIEAEVDRRIKELLEQARAAKAQLALDRPGAIEATAKAPGEK